MFRSELIVENLETLMKVGITREKAQNLARLHWVTKEYIEAQVYQAVTKEKQLLGLAIWRMEHGRGICLGIEYEEHE